MKALCYKREFIVMLILISKSPNYLKWLGYAEHSQLIWSEHRGCKCVCAGACECDQLSVMNVSVALKAGSITAGAT